MGKVLAIKKAGDSSTTISEVTDGLENLIASLGTEQDKRQHGTFVNRKRLSQTEEHSELDALYQTDWLSKKLVNIKPDDMTREWRTLDGDIEPDQVQEFEEEEERLDLTGAFNFADKWSRLYGTAFIVMAVDDGQTPDKPLNIDAIKLGGLQHIKVIDRHRMHHTGNIITNPLDSNFGFPEYYTPVETSIRIHHSRVLRFDGEMTPFDIFRRNNYNADSILDSMYDSILNFNTAVNSAASMIYETNVDIITIKGLMNHLSTKKGEALIRKRLTLMNQLKSFNNALVKDKDEEFTTKTNTFAGLKDLIDAFGVVLAAAGDVPATRLLGTSASGLNATGEGDLKNYYDSIGALQVKKYKPNLTIIDQIMAASLGLPDDADLSYEFNSLFQISDTEQADIDLKNSQRDDIYLNQGAVPISTVTKELKQNNVYTNIDDEYITELEKFEKEFDNEELDPDEENAMVPKSESENESENESDDDPKPTLNDIFRI